MSQKKPLPLFTAGAPKICPICGKGSYSAAGIHPQCAIVQADRASREKLASKTEKQPSQVKSNSKDLSSRWSKACPRCNLKQHVRKKVCSCGYSFASATNRSDAEDSTP